MREICATWVSIKRRRLVVSGSIGEPPDPPHAVGGRLGMVAELLCHAAGAAADAELPYGAADRLRHSFRGRGVRAL
jgi:hypothetical protein